MASSLDPSAVDLSVESQGEQTVVHAAPVLVDKSAPIGVASTQADATVQVAPDAPGGSMDITSGLGGQAVTLDGLGRTQNLSASLPTQGQTFGDYELVKEIARGGMGVVYQARQRSLDRTVALKMILDGQLANDTAVQRFYKEAQAAAGLDHPNIVPIYEIGKQGNRHYFTMAYIEGASLKAQVSKQRPTVFDALNYAIAIADAVAYAHAKGIIHRDLKPDNVLIDTQNRPRVTDFGLAKRIQGDVNLTGAGQILGTPSYMAPEQALGGDRKIGPGADIYAVGGLLYFLLTGFPPIQGESLGEVISKVITEPPIAPRELNIEVPEDVQALILKCLEKDPAKRYLSAGELAAALKASARRHMAFSADATKIFSTADVYTPARISRWPLMAGLAALLVIGVGLSLLADPFGWFANPAKTDGIDKQANLSPIKADGGQKTSLIPVKPEQKGKTDKSSLVNSIPIKEPIIKIDPKDGIAPKDGNNKVVPIPDPEVFKEFDAKQPALAQLPTPTRKDFGLKVELRGGVVNKDGIVQLKHGEELTFEVTTDKDAYVAIWSFEANGKINQMLPNRSQKGLVKARQTLRVPDPTDQIEAEKTDGVEYVRVLASEKPLKLPQGDPEGIFQVFRNLEQRREFVTTLRGFVGKARNVQMADQVIGYQVNAK